MKIGRLVRKSKISKSWKAKIVKTKYSALKKMEGKVKNKRYKQDSVLYKTEKGYYYFKGGKLHSYSFEKDSSKS